MPEVDQHAKQLRRVLGVSKFNAWSVTIIAGLFTLFGLLSLSVVGMLVGSGVIAAGLMEFRGHRRLEAGEPGAREWMAGSQVWLMTWVLGYCVWRLLSFDPAMVMDAIDQMLSLPAVMSPELQEAMQRLGISTQELGAMVTKMYYTLYGVVALLTTVFQGSLGAYYWLRVGKLEAARAVTD